MLTLTINPASLASDLRALLDSYGVRVTMGDKVFLEVPLFMLRLHQEVIQHSVSSWAIGPVGDLDIGLVRCSPFLEDGEPSYTRWPFWVEATTWISLSVGRQVTRFDFVPGQSYLERGNGNV